MKTTPLLHDKAQYQDDVPLAANSGLRYHP